MRSWLLSPAVALIGLAASLVTLLQVAVQAARWALRLPGARAPEWMALAAVVVSVGVAVLEWPAVVAEAKAIGNGGLMGDLYPVAVNGMAVVAALVLLLAVRERWRPPVLTPCLGVASLVLAGCLYELRPGAPVWGVVVVFAVPVVLGVAYVPALLGRRDAGAARAAA